MNLRARAPRHKLYARHAPIKCVALSPREDYYAIGAADGDIKVPPHAQHTAPHRHITQRAVSCGRRGDVLEWNLRARAPRHKLHAHHAPIKCVALSPREDYYAIGAADGDIKVPPHAQRTAHSTQHTAHSTQHTAPHRHITQRAVSCGRRCDVLVWNLRARHAPIKCVALSPREDYYAIGAADGDIKVFSLATHQLLYTFAGEHARSSFFKHIGQGVTQIHIDNAGRLFSCGADGTMKVRKLPERDSPPLHQPQY
ncbi:unnamed protein product [Parnassius apollo]|uniref:(apollo) hypothetical protein n=1 Tax=Parnassius apollo TaxID=110799 RepID=A0A8S3WKU0_PARAO|nr:unnamed protein product [Parnassius apollo]